MQRVKSQIGSRENTSQKLFSTVYQEIFAVQRFSRLSVTVKITHTIFFNNEIL